LGAILSKHYRSNSKNNSVRLVVYAKGIGTNTA